MNDLQTATSYWQCPSCGSYMDYGTEHKCPSNLTEVSYTYMSSSDVWLRIAKALERIADALEAMK